MSKLPSPDSFHHDAAVGWHLLGNAREAATELERIREAHRRDPDVLETEWMIRASLEQWEACAVAAERLVQSAADRVSGWIHRAYAVRRMASGGLDQAWDLLLPAVERFPGEPLIPFNLACYACQLGREQDAVDWLDRALKIIKDAPNRKALLEMALADEDLQPLRDRISRMLSSARNPGVD